MANLVVEWKVKNSHNPAERLGLGSFLKLSISKYNWQSYWLFLVMSKNQQ